MRKPMLVGGLFEVAGVAKREKTGQKTAYRSTKPCAAIALA